MFGSSSTFDGSIFTPTNAARPRRVATLSAEVQSAPRTVRSLLDCRSGLPLASGHHVGAQCSAPVRRARLPDRDPSGSNAANHVGCLKVPGKPGLGEGCTYRPSDPRRACESTAAGPHRTLKPRARRQNAVARRALRTPAPCRGRPDARKRARPPWACKIRRVRSDSGGGAGSQICYKQPRQGVAT